MDKNNIDDLTQKQKDFYATGQTKDINISLNYLKKLKLNIQKNEEKIYESLEKDLRKPRFESYETEIGLILELLTLLIKKLKTWAKPKKVKTSIAHFISTSYIYNEPFGNSLIISPWNYPFLLALDPVIGSISAGNTAILKPSEISSHTSQLLQNIISAVFPEEHAAVIQGGIKESKILLETKWDYIFFTGSSKVGKIVYESAAKTLTPVTLELGGKSPCIVDQSADIPLSAKRIVWGKFLNGGQTCVAPDYLAVHENVKEDLLESMTLEIKKSFGNNPSESREFCRIISDQHYQRLSKLLGNGKIICGGVLDQSTKYISPTILSDIKWDDPIMQEEIFGPIIAVLAYKDLDKLIKKINDRPKPLSIYIFTSDKSIEKKVLSETSSGGGAVNDTVIHFSSHYLPVGGVGESGMGMYHGKYSFDTFSHKKSIIKKWTLLDLPVRYPPYKNLYYKVLKIIFR